MTIIRSHGAALVAALLLALGTAAQADTTLVYTNGQNNDKGQLTVLMRDGEIRIDDAGQEWQLYRARDKAIFAVKPSAKSYTRLDKGTAGAIRGQLDDLRAQIENRVQQLPEAQRAAARAAMASQVPALSAARERVSLDRSGGTDTVAGVNCSVVQVVRDGEAAEKLCVANADALGLSNKTFATVKSMFSLLQTILAGTGLDAVGLPYLKLSGMPVRFIDSNSGQRRELVSVSHKSIVDSRFDIPGDYVEKSVSVPTR